VRTPADRLDLVEEIVEIGGRRLRLLQPRDSEALLDEQAFEQEEFLPYWAELWPSGVALARYVAGHVRAGARVLELGCGLALPSIAAALAGARVLATDWSPEAIVVAAENARRNGLEVETARCSWADPAQLVVRAPWDVVLAADVLYEGRDVPLLLALLPQLVDGAGEVLLADPRRPRLDAFLEAAAERWRVETVVEQESPRVLLLRLRAR
jgi:predicted nicotinamide N-methyase